MSYNNINNSDKTNRAWERLYLKLNAEGLIQGYTVYSNRHNKIKRAMLIGGVAAILCIAFAISLVNYKENNKKGILLTTSNTDISSLVTTLEDGSIVFLATNTSITYPEHFKERTRDVVLKGEAYFNVSGNKEHPFIIEAEKAVIEVIGTEFNIANNTENTFELSVWSGKVKVTDKLTNETVLVPSGTTVILQNRKFEFSQNSNKLALKSYTNNFRFKDELVENILKVLEINYPDIKIEVAPEIGERRLTVAFSDNSPEFMIELICKALNLNYSTKGDTIIINKPE